MQTRAVCLALLALSVLALRAGDAIEFTNRVETFTNLQGEVFKQVTLIRGDLDGVVWGKEASGGRVCYTNLSLGFLEHLGIPTNRAQIAQRRAAQSALAHARFLAERQAGAAADSAAREQARKAWLAAAPDRELLSKIEQDLAAIDTLQSQIDEAKAKIRRAKAITSDYNSANKGNDYAPHAYVKQTEQLKIDEAQIRLQAMRKEFNRKYTVEQRNRAAAVKEGN
jgi:hypothetical protein